MKFKLLLRIAIFSLLCDRLCDIKVMIGKEKTTKGGGCMKKKWMLAALVAMMSVSMASPVLAGHIYAANIIGLRQNPTKRVSL